jgi:hypothetical protein
MATSNSTSIYTTLTDVTPNSARPAHSGRDSERLTAQRRGSDAGEGEDIPAPLSSWGSDRKEKAKPTH